MNIYLTLCKFISAVSSERSQNQARPMPLRSFPPKHSLINICPTKDSPNLNTHFRKSSATPRKVVQLQIQRPPWKETREPKLRMLPRRPEAGRGWESRGAPTSGQREDVALMFTCTNFLALVELISFPGNQQPISFKSTVGELMTRMPLVNSSTINEDLNRMTILQHSRYDACY
jgi:hypothetical protein